MNKTSSGSSPSPQRRRGRVRYWRTVFVPVLVIAAIALAVWWIDYRPGSSDPTSESSIEGKYGTIEHSLSDVADNIGPQEGSVAPDFLLASLNGDDIRLSDQLGSPVIINFWATWCAPCRWEIPQLIEIYQMMHSEGLLILAINLQEGDDVVASFADEFGMNFPVLLDRGGEVAESYSLLGVPTTYFIDRSGVVKGVIHGAVVEEMPNNDSQGSHGDGPLMRMVQEIIEK